MVSEQSDVCFGDRLDAGRRLGNPQNLRMLAEDTGGRDLINSRNFAATLDGVAGDLRTYDSLAFWPPDDDDELNAMRLELRAF